MSNQTNISSTVTPLVTIDPKTKTMRSTDLLLVVNNASGKNIELKTFHRNIRNLFVNQEGTRNAPTLRANGQVQYYNLDEVECNMIMASIDVRHLRLISEIFVVVKNHQNNSLPSSYPEALRSLADEVEAHGCTKVKLEEKTIQLDESMEWYTCKRVAFANDLNPRDLCWSLLKEAGDFPCKKVFDSNFPKGVNSYHKSAWLSVYPQLTLPTNDFKDGYFLE